MADSRTLELVIKLNDQLSGGLKGAVGELERLEPQFQKVALYGGAAFTAVGLAIGFSTKQAMEAESSQNRLTQLLTTASHATSEQVRVLSEQADALSRVGVVSDDNIRIVQSQLATFNLSAEAIGNLTPAILDYIIAEKGASATTEDFRQMTNGLALALNGNYTSLTRTGFVLDDVTKSTIENGNETQKTAAIVKVLDSTYKDFNKTARTTSEGSLKVMNNEFERMQEEIGNALLPAMTKLVDVVTPMISRFADFASENKDLTAAVFAVAGVLTGLVTVLGVLGLVIPAVTTAVAALGMTIGVALPWIGLLTAAVGAAVYVSGKLTGEINEETSATERATAETQKQIEAIKAARNPTEEFAGAIKKVSKEAEESANKIANLRKEALKVVQDLAQNEASSKRGLAEELVAQEQRIAEMKVEKEQRVADLKKDINEQAAKLQTTEDFKRLEELRNNLILEETAFNEKITREEEALKTAGFIRIQFANEVSEAERRASLTSFQRRIEDIMGERVASLQKHLARLQEINEEIAAEQRKNAAIVASTKAAQEEIRNEITKTTTHTLLEAAKQQQAFQGISSNIFSSSSRTGGVTTPMFIPGRASGGPVSGGSPYIVGENGPELFVPRTSGSIVPNGAGGGVVVNVYGDVSGTELVERVQEAIMSSLRMNTKFAI